MNKDLADSLTEKWDSKKVQALIDQNDIETLKYLAQYNSDIFYEDVSLNYPTNILFTVINDGVSSPATNLYNYIVSHQSNISTSELSSIFDKFINDASISVSHKTDLFKTMLESDGQLKDIASQKVGVYVNFLTSQNIDEIYVQLFDFIADLSKNYLVYGDTYIKLKNFVVKSNNTEYMVRFVENTHIYEPEIEERMSKNGYKPTRYFAALNEVTNLTSADVVKMFNNTQNIDEKCQILKLNKAKEVQNQLIEDVIKSDKYADDDISHLLNNLSFDKKAIAKLIIENYNLRSNLVINLLRKQQIKLDDNDLQVDDYLATIIDGVVKTGDNNLYNSIIAQCKTKGAKNRLIQSTIHSNNAELMLQLIVSNSWAANIQPLLTAFKNCANENQLKQFQEFLQNQNVNDLKMAQANVKQVVNNPELSKLEKANAGMEALNDALDETTQDKIANDNMVNKLSKNLITAIQMGNSKEIIDAINTEYANRMFKMDNSIKNGIFIALARRVKNMEPVSSLQLLEPILKDIFDKNIIDEYFLCHHGLQQKLQRTFALSNAVVKLFATKNISLNQYTNQLCTLGMSAQDFKKYLKSTIDFCNINQACEQLKIIVTNNFTTEISNQVFLDILKDEKYAKLVENLSNINSKFCRNVLSAVKDYNQLTTAKNFNLLPKDAKDALEAYSYMVNKNA